LKSNLSKTKRNIILTHHAPLFTGVFQRQYENSYYSCLFASNMNDLYSDVDTWVYGHTHKNMDIKIGPRFISNPYGFTSDQNSYFDKIFYL
jgi:predicted phosphodiesterase